MRRVLHLANDPAQRSFHRAQSIERHVAAVSRFIWPWQDSWLLPLVALLAALDLVSTYALLELSGKTHVYESGPLARWALQIGGFNGLYVMNAVAVGFLCVIATSARLFYVRCGLNGFARTAYVAVWSPMPSPLLRQWSITSFLLSFNY